MTDVERDLSPTSVWRLCQILASMSQPQGFVPLAFMGKSSFEFEWSTLLKSRRVGQASAAWPKTQLASSFLTCTRRMKPILDRRCRCTSRILDMGTQDV